MEWEDIPDLTVLITPRTLSIESGTNYNVFIFPDTTKAYSLLEKIFIAAKSPQNLERDVASVGHTYVINRFIPFLSEHL